MPQTLQNSDIPDLIEATLDDLGSMRLTDLSVDTVDHVFFNQIMQSDRVDKQSGANIRIPFLSNYNNTSRFRGLYATDGPANQVNALDHGVVPWRAGDFYWCWDEDEIAVNAGESEIQDYVKVKRNQALIGWAEFIENWAAGAPPVTTDKTTPFNLKYWVNKSLTAGFYGTVPSGWSTVGGISPTTYTRWANYTAGFADVTEDDLIKKWRTATRKIGFRPPIGVNYPDFNTGNRYIHLTVEANIADFERLAEKRNDNLGYDFAAQMPTFARAPIMWWPALDTFEGSNGGDCPIYSLNLGLFKLVILRGKWMKERPATQAPLQHTVWVVWVDSRLQMVCYDRRRQSVLSKATANA